MFESLKIIALAVASAVVYGIVHDQFTARICVEYFTVGHPPVFQTQSPTLLALGWGVIATWWVGVILGIPAALLARFGSKPKISARQLIRPIGFLFAIAGTGAVTVGTIAYVLARNGTLFLMGPIAQRVPEAKHAAFIADSGAHLASYGVGFIGGIVLCIWIWRERRMAALHEPQRSEMTKPQRGETC
jgi:hypothetical protein